MGLKELDLLKTTLLKIDDVDNEVKQLRDESKILRKEIKNIEGTNTKRKLVISNLEQQIPTLENKIANIEEGGSPSSSDDQSKINELTKKLTIIEEEENELVAAWKKSLNECPSEDILPLNIWLIGGIITLIISIYLTLPLYEGWEMNPLPPILASCGLLFVLLFGFGTLGGIMEDGLQRRRGVQFQLELEQIHGQLGYHYTSTLVDIRYTEEEMVNSCRICNYKFTGFRNENGDSQRSTYNKLQRHFNKVTQPYPTDLFNVNSRKKKLLKRISTLKTQINKIDKKVQNIKDSKTEIIKKKQSITKKQSQIDKEKSSAKRKEKQVDTNATKVKQLKKERKNLWASISHLIPYSDLIN